MKRLAMMQWLTRLCLLLALLSLLLPGCPTLAAPDTPSPAPPVAPAGNGADPYPGLVTLAVVPFTSLTHDGADGFLPVVKARIGTVDATFLVDTGTINTGITTSLAKRLGLTPKSLLPNGQKTNEFGQTMDAIPLPIMQVGNINFKPTQVQVYPDSVWNPLKLDVDGVLGLQYLGGFTIEFDFCQHRLTFVNPRAVTPDLLQKAGYGMSSYSIDITPDEYGFYKVTLGLTDGKSHANETAVVDTGSYMTQISAKAANSLHLSPTGPPIEYGGLRKSQEVSPAHVGELWVGQLRLADVVVRYPQKDDPAAIPPVLGMDILSGYKVLLDFSARKMYLQSPVAAPTVQVKPSVSKGPQTP